jgi:hypothetical protein
MEVDIEKEFLGGRRIWTAGRRRARAGLQAIGRITSGVAAFGDVLIHTLTGLAYQHRQHQVGRDIQAVIVVREMLDAGAGKVDIASLPGSDDIVAAVLS